MIITNYHLDHNKIIDDYLTNKQSSIKLANKYNCSKTTILNILKKHNVKMRDLSESHIGHKPWNKDKKIDFNRYPNYGTKGKKYSKESRIKLSKSHKGQVAWNKGKPFSKETRFKMSIAKKELLKDKTRHNNWQGGKSFEQYPADWTKTLKRSIRERDNYTCKLCNKLQTDDTFHIHHIDYDKKNCNPNNLITLCKNCHCKTNFKRNKWKEYLKKIMEIND